MPLQARVTLEMVPFDGRAVGAAPEGCDRCLGCRCEHILNAQRVFGSSSWPKSVGSTSTVVCVLVGPLGARVSLKMVHFDGRAVGGAPDAISFKVHYEHLTTAKGSRDAFLGVTKSRVQSFSAVVCMGRPLRAHVLVENLRYCAF